MSSQIYLFEDEQLTALDVAAGRPLRWAAWHPDGSWCLLVGNGGTALRYEPGESKLRPIDTGTKRNLRGAAFSPDGNRALLVGNRGAVLLYDGRVVEPLPSPSNENLRRVAWHPDGEFALIVGNGGTALRYQAPSTLRLRSGQASLRAGDALAPLPGDRAHTLRAIAWRPDGAYALIGAYATRFAGYPRPHPLYKCDGRYVQALLATDDDDDFVAIDWHPDGRQALIAGYAYDERTDTASSKLLTYDGAGFGSQAVETTGALLGAAWHPSGEYALLCGEGGALLRYTSDGIEQLASGTRDNLVGPFWQPDGSSALLLRGPGERMYTV